MEATGQDKGIQLTLFEYFADADKFSLQDAKECVYQYAEKNVKEPSIRARIYEGINKGLFQRGAKGVYTVTKKNEANEDITCMLIQGDGRDLSFIEDNSIDAIITDHPYLLKNSLKGGNRDFASYDLFRYSQQDLDEKYRVLKKGHFLVEFLPEENSENYEYIYQVKTMAKVSGFEYYAKVTWKKGTFIANTGRKAKNAEDILFFSKGRARDMRPDAKKDKAEPGVKHYMSGAKGMLPTMFDVQPPVKPERRHQAEKPVELLKQIMDFVSEQNDWILDQFSGSFSLAEAAFEAGRNSVNIEIHEEYFESGKQRIDKVKNRSR